MTSTDEPMTWRHELIATATDVVLARAVLSALENLLQNDAELLVRDVNERSITGALAGHLQEQFTGWKADCEYNRDGHAVKRANGQIVVPDIIIHHRGTPDNLLVIEVKKSNTGERDEEDLAKLGEFRRSHLAYRNALFVKLVVHSPKPDVRRVQWV